MTTPEEFIAAAKQASVEQVRAMLAENPVLAGAEDAQGISAVRWAAYFQRGEVAEAIGLPPAASPEGDGRRKDKANGGDPQRKSP